MNNYEYKMTPLEEAYEILEQAYETPSKEKKITLAQKAYKKSNKCLEAILLLEELEENTIKSEELIDKHLKKEEERLRKEKYFTEENIGEFYTIIATRPYIRTLYRKALRKLELGKTNRAIEILKEILKLNKNDNIGARYDLMAAYALTENANELIELIKKYNGNNLISLFSLLVLYYKKDETKKAIETLKKINKNNEYFIKIYKGTFKINEKIESYSIGSPSEVINLFQNYQYLLYNVPGIKDFIIEYS